MVRRDIERGEDYLADPMLRGLYQRTRGPIAFVDESHHLPTRNEIGYYTLTGCLFERENLVAHRRRLLTVGATRGGRPFHATDLYNQGRYGQIRRFVEVVAQRAEWSIVTTEVPLESSSARTLARARESCLEQLLVELTRGPAPVGLVVLDTLDEAGNRADQKLAKRLRANGRLPGGHEVLLRHSDDDREPMLTAPDGVGWATRRLLDRGETQWVEKAAPVLSVIHATTQERVDVMALVEGRRPENHNSAGAALADIPAPGLENGPVKSGPLSPLLPPSVSHEETRGSTANTPIEELAERTRALRKMLGDPESIRAAKSTPARRPTRRTPGPEKDPGCEGPEK